MAKRGTTARYGCVTCDKPCEASPDSLLAMLQICQGCQDKRFAAGTAARLKAEKLEAARG